MRFNASARRDAVAQRRKLLGVELFITSGNGYVRACNIRSPF